MELKEGYVCYVKDEYFSKIKQHIENDFLMYNKLGHRPHYYCMKDEKTGLLWLVPMSSQTKKYQKHYNNAIEKYGKSLKIIMGEFQGNKSAFLLQNMFPVTEKYIDHIHTYNGKPALVKPSIQTSIKSNVKKLKSLIAQGKNKAIFTYINKIEKIMLDEMKDKKLEKVADKKMSLDDRISAATKKAEKHNQGLNQNHTYPKKKGLDR